MQNRKTKYDNKFVRKTIRFTNNEFELIKKELNEHHITFTEFARSAILKQEVKTNLDKQFLYQLNKIGNNLNQIAKSVNQNEEIDVLQQLINIETMLKDIK